MSILSNVLINKYFGCHCPDTANVLPGSYHYMNCSARAMALRILEAMEAPIRKGDRFLLRFPNNGLRNAGRWVEESLANERDEFTLDFHPNYLRLPSAFQPSRQTKPKECECICHQTHECECGKVVPAFRFPQPPPSAPKLGVSVKDACPACHEWDNRCTCKPTPETPKCAECGMRHEGEFHGEPDRKPDEVELVKKELRREYFSQLRARRWFLCCCRSHD